MALPEVGVDHGLVTVAIAREEALERLDATSRRRELAKADYAKTREKIDLKLGEQIKAAFKVGLTASAISKRVGLSVPRVYQLRNDYVESIRE